MASYFNQISSLNPKIWYRFNETAGTPVNSGSLSTTSTFNNLLQNEQTDVDGRAIYFNGSNSNIILPAHPAFSLFDDRSFTIECWVKASVTDVSGIYQPILFNAVGGASSRYISLELAGSARSGTPGKVVWIANNGSGNYREIISATRVDDNNWHHIVAVHNTTSMKIYIDGQLSVSGVPLGSSNFDIDIQTNKKVIGQAFGANGTNYKGRMDEFAVYDRELTAAQVLANFNAGASVEFADIPGTASALMLQPTQTTTAALTATPMTASATGEGHAASTVNFPTMLETYLSGRTLETWYKFNTSQQLTNYGSLPTKVSIFETDALTVIGAGVQGSGALLTTGGVNGGVVNLSDNVGPLIADKDFSLGFWVKKLNKEAARIIYVYDTQTSGDFIDIGWNTDGGITTSAFFSNNTNTIASSTDITDGNWHYVAVRQSNNTLQMWIDNTSIGTQTITHSYSALDTLTFGNDNGNTSVTEKMYISQFYVATAANITSTEISNIYTAGTSTEIQASAAMPEAKARFNSAFNDYIVSKNPLLDFRLDEGSGAPLDYGSAGLIVVSQQSPQGYTQGEVGLNTRAFKFTDRIQAIRGNYSFASGTLSSANECTIGIVFKSGNATNQQAFVGFGGRGGTQGTGFSLQQLASSGYLRIIAGNSNGTTNNFTGTTNVADNKWHLAVIVKEASAIKLYIDGKLDINSSSTNTLTDAGEFAIAAISGIDATTASRNTLIDEIFVTSGVFSAQEAFEAWQKLRLEMDTTATASLPMPTTNLGTGYINSASPALASAELVNPGQDDTINILSLPATASALFVLPNFGGNVVIDANYGHVAFEASAVFHMPQYQIGEFNSADHMNASALMIHPISTGGGKISVPTAVAESTLVMPGIVTVLGARVFAEPMRSNAVFLLPPAYYLVSDDKWYQRLLDVDYQSSQYAGTVVFFNTSNDIVLNGGYGGLNAHSTVNLYSSPTPKASAGLFDPVSRRALNLKNIALSYSPNGSNYTDGWTMETMIQTTKKNQFLTASYFTSTTSRNKRTGIRLKDGKIALVQVKDQSGGLLNSKDPIAFTGFKDIADGQWHHIIIQYRDDDNRIQIWIDGKLDIQRYGYTSYQPLQIGYNSNDIDAYSDFNISAFAVNSESFVLEREISLNYFAATGHIPYEAEPFTATVTLGTGTRAKGNRARALMLYFWPTFNAASGYYVGQYNNPFSPVGVNSSGGHDVGNSAFDYDTFAGLTTYLTKDTQKYFDWDVFPLPVKRFYAGDTYVGDRNPLLNESVMIKSGTPQGTVYVDPVTDNYRYLDLMKDVYELDQYDAIFFRNYPDQSNEKQLMGLNSYTEVDEYFNLQEKELFAAFLDSLREAIDTYGISLFVTNPQLAIDLGIIKAATPVPLLRDNGIFNKDEYSDNRAPVVTGRCDAQGNPTDPVNQYGAGWYDTWLNDRHRVINTLEYLTDDNTFIWTDYAFYQNADEFSYGGPDRYYARYENRPYGLQIGDEFVFADSGNPKYRLPYQAIKPEDLITGIPITALGRYVWNQNKDSYVQVDNPYKDYITTVALPPGTRLKGKLTNGKIFVSFSENFANNFTAESPQFNTRYAEYHQYDMASNYWVDIAFNAGIIDANTRALYKNSTLNEQERGQPPLYSDNDSIKQYWSLSGDNLVSQITPITRNLVGFVGGDPGPEVPEINRKRTRAGLSSLPPSIGTRVRDALGRFASGGGSFGIAGGNLKTFKITMGRVYDTGTVFIPSINTRGLWWLSDKNKLEGKVVGGVGMSVSATMVNPTVTANHPALINTTAMIAQAEIFDSTFRSGDKINLTFPLFAQAMMPSLGGVYINAAPATGSGDLLSSYVYTQSDYVVTLYLRHTDPILYIRKEVIK